MPRKIEVEVIADADKYRRGLKSSAQETENFGSKLGGMAKAAGLAAGAAGLGALIVSAKSSVEAASNLSESQNAVNVVFGKSAKTIENFSKNAAAKAGLSMRALNEAVTPLGAAFVNVGFSQDKAAKASITLAKRAADMASVFNTDVSTALEAIQAGLRGEADPLEKFGVGMSAAAVQAKAMSMGLVKAEVDTAKVAMAQVTLKEKMAAAAEALKTSGKNSDEYAKASAHAAYADAQLTKALTGKIPPLDANQKAQAGLALIMEQTNRLQGDFANTSDGAANAQRVLSANIENLQATIGAKLLPVVAAITVKLNEVVTWVIANWPKIEAEFKKSMDNIQQVIDRIKPILKVIVDQIVIVTKLVKAIIDGDWSEVWSLLWQAVKNAIKLVKEVIELEISLVFAAMKKLGKAALDGFVDGVKALPGLILDAVKAIPGLILSVEKAIFNAALNLGVAVVKGIASGLSGAGRAVGGAIADGVEAAINEVINRINRALELTITIPIPFAKDKHININPPDIPQLARGGIVTRPTLAMIGEAGPEAVVPLGRGRGMGTTVIVNVQGALLGSSVPQVAETIRRELLKLESRNGRPALGT